MNLKRLGERGKSLNACMGAAKTFGLHPDDTWSVEGGLTEARMLGSHVYSSLQAHSTK